MVSSVVASARNRKAEKKNEVHFVHMCITALRVQEMIKIISNMDKDTEGVTENMNDLQAALDFSEKADEDRVINLHIRLSDAETAIEYSGLE